MAERFNINVITPKTKERTCKIQVVDKGRPRDNRDKTKKYQLMILQDEEENQVECIIFNAEIMHFEDLFCPFHTYLVSVALVKDLYVWKSTTTEDQTHVGFQDRQVSMRLSEIEFLIYLTMLV
ncbi:hypothetical protein A4A49_54090 [Nicotiana attenuata]|uniref:Replication factor A C-terminal domain-containing protein n=1 Tax=Nicotiana attenuata TaxID=49451 RepID=A0A314LDH4_NICAT|nr:hypothetical protein A4A49_54090 [Nicotiana attenuata]